jgi:hypothetical protein
MGIYWTALRHGGCAAGPGRGRGEPSAHIQLQDAWMSERIALNHMLAVVVGIAD